MTLHAVAADDYPAFHRAMVHVLRRSRLGDARFTKLGLSVAEADALIGDVLAFASEARTNAEVDAMLTERIGDRPNPGVWWALRTFVPVVHAPTGGPWSYADRPSYVASRGEPFSGDEADAVAVLVRRYLDAFGPASPADIGQFTSIPQPPIRAALDLLSEELDRYDGPDGKPMYDVLGGLVPPEETPAPPRLMAMWDNVLLAYRDRSRVIPDAYRKLVIRTNGDTLPTVLVDGSVVGVWRPAPRGTRALEVTAFQDLDDAAWAALEAEASSLLAFIADRQPDVYRRYGRWWEGMPAAERRLLG
jgi:hypothetical protein